MKAMLLRACITFMVPALLLVTVTGHAAVTGTVSDIQRLDITFENPDRSTVVEMLSSVILDDITIDGTRVTEFSALAWDEDENILYAVSDNGYLLHLRPVLDKGELSDVKLIEGYPLLDSQGNPLRGKLADSEGIAVRNERNNIPGDTELYISFERVPRIIQYSNRGRYIQQIPLPAALARIENYRGENRSLESLLYHDTLGLLTGPELPLEKDSPGQLVVYSLDGHLWRVLAHDHVHGALVDLAAMDGGRIMLLERAYNGPLEGIIITLHCLDPYDQRMTSEIASLQSGGPMFNENFEGLAHLGNGRYLMISDDNNHPLMQTRLVYFRLIPAD